MAGEHDKPNRWRPKFSVRTLVVMVAVLGLYFGCWEITKRNGVPSLANHLDNRDQRGFGLCEIEYCRATEGDLAQCIGRIQCQHKRCFSAERRLADLTG